MAMHSILQRSNLFFLIFAAGNWILLEHLLHLQNTLKQQTRVIKVTEQQVAPTNITSSKSSHSNGINGQGDNLFEQPVKNYMVVKINQSHEEVMVENNVTSNDTTGSNHSDDVFHSPDNKVEKQTNLEVVTAEKNIVPSSKPSSAPSPKPSSAPIQLIQAPPPANLVHTPIHPSSSRCNYQHFQENHWNCATRTFEHNCDAKQLSAGLAAVDQLHFAGDSLSRNRFMTAAIELSGKLPLNDTLCPQDDRTLPHFIEKCRGHDCIHNNYNYQHFVPVHNLTILHTLVLWMVPGEAKQAIKDLKPNDVMFLSAPGVWLNYDIAKIQPRVEAALKDRPRKGELIVWIGMNHVGHLKRPDNLAIGQNNTMALALNDHMREHHKEIGLDDYIDFFNLTRDSDDCARQENETETKKWANFDGTHATAEPNRMMHLGVLTYLQEHLKVLKGKQRQQQQQRKRGLRASFHLG